MTKVRSDNSSPFSAQSNHSSALQLYNSPYHVPINRFNSQFSILDFIASSHIPTPCEEIGNKSSLETTHFNILLPLLLLFHKFSIFSCFPFLTHFSFILDFPYNSPQLHRAHSTFGQFCPMPLSNSSFAGPSAHAITNCLFVYDSQKPSIRMSQISPISAYLCISASIPQSFGCHCTFLHRCLFALS